MTRALLSTLRLGTRRSPLALRQADLVAGWLVERGIAGTVERVPIVTRGDREADRPIAEVWGTGVFARELDDAVLDGRVDIAVHSLKDLPVERPDGIVTAAVPLRADPRDALVARGGVRLADLPAGSRVGTSSPRRRLQLGAARPDLAFCDIRGNVDTRLRAVEEGRVDAVVLALAGLARLGRSDAATETFEPAVCAPAAGQGALAVEIRADDERLRDVLAERLDDPGARAETTAERSFLAALGGGCRVPVGALARAAADGTLRLVGAVADPEGGRVWRDQAAGEVDDPSGLGRLLATRAPRDLVAASHIAERPHGGA